MQITLNLASRPFVDLKTVLNRMRIAMGVLALVAIALGVVLHFVQRKTEQTQARAHSIDAALAKAIAERQGYEALMQRPENAKVLDQTDGLNQLFDEKAFSWTVVMQDLETVMPGPVELSTIEPVRSKDGSVTLHLRVVGPRDRNIELVENMERSRRFRQPRIVGESPESQGGLNQKLEPVSASTSEDLDLLTEYNTAPREETGPAARPENAAQAKTPAKASACKTCTAPAAMAGISHPPAMRPHKPRPGGAK